MRLFWRLHRAVMRLTAGRFGRVGPMDALLLTTKGRKSGGPRDVVLFYIRDSDAYIVVASYAGEDRDLAWWKNLKAHPEADVTVAGKRIRVRARESEGTERERLWTRIVQKDPGVRRIPAADEGASCGGGPPPDRLEHAQTSGRMLAERLLASYVVLCEWCVFLVRSACFCSGRRSQ